jgi:hypothetical protein
MPATLRMRLHGHTDLPALRATPGPLSEPGNLILRRSQEDGAEAGYATSWDPASLQGA